MGGRLVVLLSLPAPRYLRSAVVATLVVVLLGAAAWASIIVAGGVNLRAFEQHRSDGDTSAFNASSLAQSFVSPRDGLSQIDLEMSSAPDLKGAGRIKLVKGDGTGGQAIYDSPLGSASFAKNPFLSITFQPVAHSRGITYTLVLETPGIPAASALSVRYNSFDALSSGRFYADGRPQRGDLSLAAYYRYTPATFISDAGDVLGRNGLLALSWLLLLMAPGMALLLWLPNGLSMGQRIVAAPGVSALALPVLMLLARSLFLRLGTASMWAIVLVSLAACVAWPIANRKAQRAVPPRPRDAAAFWQEVAFWGLLAAVLFLAVGGRLVPLRDQYAGMGLDAYHHTLIAEMFIRAGGIPANYLPFAPLASFTYHFGFHALLASVGWLSGNTSAQSMLPLMPQAGQVAIALPVLTMTLFAWRVLNDRWAGLAAGGLVGLVSIFPAFYVNWSRYTQGLGLALLPVAWVLLVEALEWRTPDIDTRTSRARWRDVVQASGPLMLAIVGAAGLALTHYRIAMIYAAFAVLYLIWVLSKASTGGMSIRDVLRPLYRSAILAGLTLAALSPWLVNLAQNFGTRFVGKSGEGGVGEGYYSLQSMGLDPLLAHPSMPIMFALALGGLVWAVKRKDPLPLLPAITWLILGLWSNPYLLPVRLPYSGYLDATTLATGIWLPLGLIAGYTVARFGAWVISLADNLRPAPRNLWRVAAAGALGLSALAVGAAGALGLAPMIDSKPYVAKADLDAMLWMRDNLPRSASVLANPFAFPWDPPPQAIQGSDAGLWVPLLTSGIKSSVPPIPAYNERLGDPAYIDNVRGIIGDEPFVNTSPDWNALKDKGITHIFVGSRGGAISVPLLLQSDHTRLVFHEDAVWVFELE